VSTRTETCTIVECDCCGEDLKGFEEEFTVHFDAGTNLAAELRNYEWLVEDDQHYCFTCVEDMREFLDAASVKAGEDA
jgi:hypothetical protein